MTGELQAYVVEVFPEVVKKTKDGSDFRSMKVLVEWNKDEEFPSRMVLEQGGDKKCDLAKTLVKGKEYLFKLNFRANEWTDGNGVKTAFGSVSAWKADEVIDNTQNANDATSLPF